MATAVKISGSFQTISDPDPETPLDCCFSGSFFIYAKMRLWLTSCDWKILIFFWFGEALFWLHVALALYKQIKIKKGSLGIQNANYEFIFIALWQVKSSQYFGTKRIAVSLLRFSHKRGQPDLRQVNWSYFHVAKSVQYRIRRLGCWASINYGQLCAKKNCRQPLKQIIFLILVFLNQNFVNDSHKSAVLKLFFIN